MAFWRRKRDQAPADSPPTDAVITRSWSFQGTQLCLRGLYAAVTIEVGGSDIQITAQGTTSQINSLRPSSQAEIVTLRSSPRQTNGLRITLNSLTISSIREALKALREFSRPERVLTLTIRVPQGTDLDIADITGNISVGNTRANLALSAAYSQLVAVGYVHSADLTVSSSARVALQSVTGGLSIKADYGGRVVVHTGAITELTVNCQSSSAVVVGGRIQQARVDAGYNGSVRLVQVVQSLRARLSSSAALEVGGDGVCSSVEATLDYGARLSCKDAVEIATLRLSSSSRAFITRVTSSLGIAADFGAQVAINGGNNSGALPQAKIRAESAADVTINATVLSGSVVTDHGGHVAARGYAPAVRLRPNFGRITPARV